MVFLIFKREDSEGREEKRKMSRILCLLTIVWGVLCGGVYGESGHEEQYHTGWGVQYDNDFLAFVGYFTNVSGGVFARIGLIDSPFWQQGNVDELTNILPVSCHPYSVGNDWLNEWYIWFAPRVRLVVYNALLQGLYREITNGTGQR